MLASFPMRLEVLRFQDEVRCSQQQGSKARRGNVQVPIRKVTVSNHLVQSCMSSSISSGSHPPTSRRTVSASPCLLAYYVCGRGDWSEAVFDILRYAYCHVLALSTPYVEIRIQRAR